MTSIAQAKRQVTIDALASSVQMIMIERGLDFTMDDVAEAAEVSRSTVFRHFATREDLIVAATQMGRDSFTSRIPVYRGGDWHPWLRELCLIVHEMNYLSSRTLSLATGAEVLSDRLRTLGRGLDETRRGRYPGMAETLWRATGHNGPVPDRLVTVLATHLSPFFSEAARHEAGAGHEVAARMAEDAIIHVLGSPTSTEQSPG